MEREITIDHSWDKRVNLESKNESMDNHQCSDSCCDPLVEGETIDLGPNHENKTNRIEEELHFQDIKDKFFKNADIIKLMTTRPNWNEYFMILAKIAATRSTCLSRTNGAVIIKDKQVIATGYNGSMPGVPHCSEEGSCFRRRAGTSDHEKYSDSMASACRSIHAEANAVAMAAKKGIPVEGAAIYMTLYPCYQCAKLIASAGIKKVYYEYEYKSPDSQRDEQWYLALKDAHIEIEKVDLSSNAILRTMMNLFMVTAWRRELNQDGTPTGRIEHLNMEEMFKH